MHALRRFRAFTLLTGNRLDAAQITSVLVTVRHLGAGGVVAATVAGQLAISDLSRGVRNPSRRRAAPRRAALRRRSPVCRLRIQIRRQRRALDSQGSCRPTRHAPPEDR
jgi:hypothetical protein